MNIKKHEDYFHDGSIIDIENTKNGLIISMSSSEIDPEYSKEKLQLDKFNCIRGKLHIENINKIYVHRKLIDIPLVQIYDYAEIDDFEIDGNKVLLVGFWKNNSSDSDVESGYFRYEIYAKNLYWENIPDLIDPFLD